VTDQSHLAEKCKGYIAKIGIHISLNVLHGNKGIREYMSRPAIYSMFLEPVMFCLRQTH